MYAWIVRFALLLLGGRIFRRVAQHPRVAPVMGTRKGRLALLLLGYGLGRHRKTRMAGQAVHLMRRWSR
jgi:hypothetical protein